MQDPSAAFIRSNVELTTEKPKPIASSVQLHPDAAATTRNGCLVRKNFVKR